MSETTKQVTIDGKTFQLARIPALQALRLERQLIRVLAPLLSGLSGIDFSNPEATVDLSALGGGVVRALEALPEHEFLALVGTLLSRVTAVTATNGAVLLDSDDAINSVFTDGLLTLYKLLLEVARFNKFSPFALLGSGNGLKIAT